MITSVSFILCHLAFYSAKDRPRATVLFCRIVTIKNKGYGY